MTTAAEKAKTKADEKADEKVEAKAETKAEEKAETKRTANDGGPEQGMARIALAHPLNVKYAQQVGLDPADANSPNEDEFMVGTVLDVAVDVARSLIGAGHAQVDPEDTRVVAQVLSGETEGSYEAIHGAAPKAAIVKNPETPDPPQDVEPGQGDAAPAGV